MVHLRGAAMTMEVCEHGVGYYKMLDFKWHQRSKYDAEGLRDGIFTYFCVQNLVTSSKFPLFIVFCFFFRFGLAPVVPVVPWTLKALVWP